MKDGFPNTVPAWAARLGAAGLIPFAALAAWALLGAPQHRGTAALALLAYGATIASFLGAIHWGLAMRTPGDDASSRDYLWGVLPSLIAWCAMLAGPTAGLALLAVLLWACYAVDRKRYPARALAHWLPLRLRLTVLSSLCCLAVAAAGLAA